MWWPRPTSRIYVRSVPLALRRRTGVLVFIESVYKADGVQVGRPRPKKLTDCVIPRCLLYLCYTCVYTVLYLAPLHRSAAMKVVKTLGLVEGRVLRRLGMQETVWHEQFTRQGGTNLVVNSLAVESDRRLEPGIVHRALEALQR